jgi:large subunit ribosomal protein L6
MSRIGKLPVTIPNGVTVTQQGDRITVKGPRGELSRTIPAMMKITQEDGTLTVHRPSDEPQHRALHGLSRSLVNNMVEGVTKGFQRTLEIVGVGYKAETRPYGLQLALGFSHPVEYRAPAGIKLTATNPTTVVVDGADKEVVGQVAAEIRGFRPPEPYKGKGIKYQGEQVRRKAGKAGGK